MEKPTSDFYQFSEKPFEDNPDPKFLYSTASYQELFASILTWIKEGHGFAAITGEAGTGKTFFVHVLVSHLDEKINPILFFNPVITFRDLLKQILWALKQPTQEKTETALFHQFTGFLDQMMAQDKTVLIILDEAQDLNDQTLEGIERFLDLKSKPIKIIFAGQPHFEERLNSMGFGRLGQKIETKEKIKPFTEEESRGYIDHRLRLVGNSSEIITPKAISAICSYAHGIPGSINHVCDNALWVSCTMNRKKIDIDIIEKVIQNLEGPRIIPKTLPSIQLIRQIWTSSVRSAASLKRVSMAVFLKAKQNLEGLRVTPKTLPAVHLINQIRRPLVQFAISLKRVSMAIFLKANIQNLEGLRITPKILPSIQLIRHIWKLPIQVATSFKSVSMALFLKVIQNLKGVRITPQVLPSVKLRQIWRFPTQSVASFKMVSMAILFKWKQSLESLRITPKTLPSIQLIKRIWGGPIQFAASFKRVLMALVLKVIQNLEGLRIPPKALPSIQLIRNIWKPSTPLGISSRRVSTAIFLKVKQNLEGLRIPPKTLPSIQLIKHIWRLPIQFAISLKSVPLAIILLVCLGGLTFLLYEYIGRGPMKTQVKKSFIGQELATRPSTHKPSIQGTTRGIVKEDRIRTSDRPKPTQMGSSSFKRDTVLITPKRIKQRPTKVTVDEALNKVSFLEKNELSSSVSGLKTDYYGEMPRPTPRVSEIAKTRALTITHFFAAEKGPYGCIWRIYIEAEDPDGDMDRISLRVDQASYGHYPTEWIKIKPQHRKHLRGFLQWNTFSSKASYLPEWTKISVKISITDHGGNESNEIIIPFTFESGTKNQYQLPAPFDKGNTPRIGYVMVDLCHIVL